ncbi:uncharacterized protein MKZ38_004481 [Zalerion maritima]|uniref:protein disulfide-isomerase n=1 Tax=Zalerion maritima TaxID=339359 RepID=A0AAD5WQY1_9PEZI|nr:uncharacterized protein MKZ38_004481 [Zalerion maritima]
MHALAFLAAAAAVLLVPVARAGGLYTKSSPVLQVDATNYGKLIDKSPYTSIVEFYAPWCGHCQNLKPAFEKAAKSLDGLANVAAVNCDEDENKQLCGSMGVQGFPTLKIVRPSKKSTGKPMIEDYNGERSAKSIVNAVTGAINNHVKRLQDKDRDEFMGDDGPKAILFSDKGTLSAIIKTIAIEFLDIISVAQVRNKEKSLVDEFGITEFPTLVLIPAGGEPIVYDGEMKKDAMVEFLSQARPANKKSGSSKKEKKEEKTKSEPTESEPKLEENKETEMPQSPPIPVSMDPQEISKECLEARSHTCILAFIPDTPGTDGVNALNNLAEIYTKHKHANRKLFSAFVVPSGNSAGGLIKEKLQLPTGVELVAMNARRGWWRHFNGAERGFTHESIEAWVDQIRMGEGEKLAIPPGIIAPVISDDDVSSEPSTEAGVEAKTDTDTQREEESTTPEQEESGEQKGREHEEL